MAVKRMPGSVSPIDVLDRILDKGIVIDAEIHVAVVGIELFTVTARVKVASFETWDRYVASGVHAAADNASVPEPMASPPGSNRVRLRCEHGCTLERRVTAPSLRDGTLAPQRCVVKRGRRCAVTVL